MKSLRARLLVGMIGSLALLLLAFGLLIDALIEYTLIREFDFYLETVARTLIAAVDVGGDRFDVKLVPEAFPDIQQVEGELFSQYWRDDGTTLAKSRNLAQGDLPRLSGEGGHLQTQPLVLPNGRNARAAGLRFPVELKKSPPEISRNSPEAMTFLSLVVARDTTDLESHVRQLRGILVVAGAAAMSVGAIVAFLVIRRSLIPLYGIAGEIAAIRPDELSTRIRSAQLPTEVAPIVQRLNEMLHRLDEAFARERSLTADVAHELRTPVAGILTTAGVALSTHRSVEDCREALQDILDVARHMRSMIENLLTLARLDVQSPRFAYSEILVRDLVDRCWRGNCEKATARHVAFENRVPPGLNCISDTGALTVIMSNLLENAAEYANESGEMSVDATALGETIELRVTNSGCTLTEQQLACVFDRFWRADTSRSSANLHVGLGLALVRRLATSLRGRVWAESRDGNFIARLQLPAGERASA